MQSQPKSLHDTAAAPLAEVVPLPSAAPPVEIRVLGPFESCVGGRRATVNGSKRQAVLAALALAGGRVVPVETLMDAVWSANEPAAPRNAVQHHVTRLRAELGADSIVGFPDGYALGAASVDAVLVEDHLADARAASRAGDPGAALMSATRAVDLFRGRALQGLPDSDWVCAEAGRLDSLRVDALEEQFDAALALGRHAETVSAIQTAVDENPYRERLHGQLMLALYRCGRQADALEAFRHARLVLDEELGLEPGHELRRLERAILAHDACIDLPDAPVLPDDDGPADRPAGDPQAVLQLMRAHLRRAEELYEQALAAVAVTA